ncbi:MAG: SPFH domain-containing protein [Firmicutes bacterium]|nr:SPFH domain-containing protein [Bacillota bacterium]MDY6161063.1 SPFH domain-containing protein [Candidatus Faecousia sp.]
MGLIKALVGSAGGVLADQWKEYFYCEAIPETVLGVQGQKRVSGRSSNKRGSDNLISNGSVIAVADGQCMMIVDQGKVVEFSAEPGEFTYDASTEPTIFSGSLGQSILETFKTVGKRFTFGGDTAKDQRVYYFNLKELVGNKYGTPSPVPFRVVDRNINLDWEISIRCFGEYSFHICDPLLFYTNVCGNFSGEYTRDRLESQMKTELLTALQPAFAKISDMGIRYSSLPGHTMELADALNEVLSNKWRNLRGIEIVSFGVSSVKASEEDEKMLKDMQRTAVYSNPNMAAAYDVMARGDAMKTAAGNSAGAMTGFMGMNMAQGMGGNNAAQLFQMGQQQAAQASPAAAAPAAGSWKCSCGATATGKFCPECGAKKPEAAGWKCSCGAVNQGKFCQECGARKPAGVPQYKCDKCGWVPEDPKNPPRFCPECGDKFGDEDIVL